MEVTTSNKYDIVRGGSLGQEGLEVEGEHAFLPFKPKPILHGF